MKKSSTILLFALASVSVFAKSPVGIAHDPVLGVYPKVLKGEKVNPLIQAEFQKHYGTPGNVSWSVVDDASGVRITIATFTEQGEENEVYYYDDAEVFGIGKTIRRDQLPERVTSAINERFNPGVIQTAYEFKERSSSTVYYVRVVTPRHSILISANEFGQTQVYQKEKLRHTLE